LADHVKLQESRLDSHKKYISDVVIPNYRKEIEEDLADWDYWKSWHEVSPEFQIRAENASKNMKFLSSDTYMYGMWNVIGSSSANNGLQLLSTGLKFMGAASSAAGPQGRIAGVILQGGATAVGMASADAENKAEVGEAFQSAFR